jgi:hypothetical protein
MSGAGFEFTGLRETNLALKRLGVPDPAIKEAMRDAGMLVAREAWRIAPQDTGKMASTIKVTGGKNKLVVKVGNNTTVPYAYTFHATALNRSRGGFTVHVPTYQRGRSRKSSGTTVAPYKTARRIPNRPFLFVAFERKKRELFEAYVTRIGDLFRSVSHG